MRKHWRTLSKRETRFDLGFNQLGCCAEQVDKFKRECSRVSSQAYAEIRLSHTGGMSKGCRCREGKDENLSFSFTYIYMIPLYNIYFIHMYFREFINLCWIRYSIWVVRRKRKSRMSSIVLPLKKKKKILVLHSRMGKVFKVWTGEANR